MRRIGLEHDGHLWNGGCDWQLLLTRVIVIGIRGADVGVLGRYIGDGFRIGQGRFLGVVLVVILLVLLVERVLGAEGRVPDQMFSRLRLN